MRRSTICLFCRLTDRIGELLSGPDGEINPELRPLAEAIKATPRPYSAYTWTQMNPKVPELLRALAPGEVELTHDALTPLPTSRTSSSSEVCWSTAEVCRARCEPRQVRNLDQRPAHRVANSDNRKIIERYLAGTCCDTCASEQAPARSQTVRSYALSSTQPSPSTS